MRGVLLSVIYTLALSLLLNAIAWSSHLDIPMSGDDTHVVATPSSMHAHRHDDGEQVNDCDHCCHASAHLVALLPKPALLVFGPRRSFTLASDVGLIKHITDPPFIPPIA